MLSKGLHYIVLQSIRINILINVTNQDFFSIVIIIICYPYFVIYIYILGGNKEQRKQMNNIYEENLFKIIS